jgi:hypothetical protein
MLNKDNNKWTIEEIKKNIKVLKDNQVYRISDCLKFKNTHKVIKELLSNPIYKGTLLHEFHTTDKPDFFKIMSNRKEKSKLKFYNDDDTLVVHIRSGDNFKKTGLGLKKNFDYYLDNINKSTKKKVVLITALHYGTGVSKKIYTTQIFNYNEKNHNENIKVIHDLISKINKPVEIISTENVDDDLLQLVFCKTLLTNNTSGGFARVIQKYNTQVNSKK